MTKIDKLKVNTLIKKYDYLSSQVEYLNDIITEGEYDFILDINKILNMNSELRDLYEYKSLSIEVKEKEKNNIDLKESNHKDVSRSLQKQKDPNLKKVYRKIVKITHPDKIKDDKLNNIYLEVQNMYENEDLLSFYKTCESLSIDYDIIVDINYINRELKKTENKISFLESNTIYRWVNSNKKQRNKILIQYIKDNI